MPDNAFHPISQPLNTFRISSATLQVTIAATRRRPLDSSGFSRRKFARASGNGRLLRACRMAALARTEFSPQEIRAAPTDHDVALRFTAFDMG